MIKSNVSASRYFKWMFMAVLFSNVPPVEPDNNSSIQAPSSESVVFSAFTLWNVLLHTRPHLCQVLSLSV